MSEDVHADGKFSNGKTRADLRREAEGPFPVDCVLVSHPTINSRARDKNGNQRMICVKCGDRRHMKNLPKFIYQCRGCGQKWTYPEAQNTQEPGACFN